MSCKRTKTLKGGHLGHTVFDTVYHGRPEYGFYNASEMSNMNAQVGGYKKNKIIGGSGHQGHTVIDSAYFGRPENNFYSADEMVKMGAVVGGYSKEDLDTHLNRIKGIIENMVEVSKSPEQDIVEVVSNEINPKNNKKYGKKEAQNMVDIYFELNPKQQRKNLLNSNLFRNQKGGNRVSLPLSFYSGDIPNKINISVPINDYCA